MKQNRYRIATVGTMCRSILRHRRRSAAGSYSTRGWPYLRRQVRDEDDASENEKGRVLVRSDLALLSSVLQSRVIVGVNGITMLCGRLHGGESSWVRMNEARALMITARSKECNGRYKHFSPQVLAPHPLGTSMPASTPGTPLCYDPGFPGCRPRKTWGSGEGQDWR